MMKFFLKVKNMIKILKRLIFILLLFNLVNGCQSLKDGLQGKKKSNNAQEFLIEKKSPLVLPPDFDKLPLPTSKSEKNESENEFDLKDVLENNSENVDSTEVNKKGSTEKSILEKIKNN